VLRRIFGAEREEVKRKCRKIHKEELYDVYSAPNIRVRMRWKGHTAHMG
jgi:hypothetical protein